MRANVAIELADHCADLINNAENGVDAVDEEDESSRLGRMNNHGTASGRQDYQ